MQTLLHAKKMKNIVCCDGRSVPLEKKKWQQRAVCISNFTLLPFGSRVSPDALLSVSSLILIIKVSNNSYFKVLSKKYLIRYLISRRRAGRYDCSSTTVFSIFVLTFFFVNVLTLFKSIINKNGCLIYFSSRFS